MMSINFHLCTLLSVLMSQDSKEFGLSHFIQSPVVSRFSDAELEGNCLSDYVVGMDIYIRLWDERQLWEGKFMYETLP